MLIRLIGWLLACLCLFPGPVRADDRAPDVLVKEVTEEVVSILREDKGIRAGNRDKAISLIEEKVAPHFDFTRMTALAVGRPWRTLDPADRKELEREFRALLVRTYANSLSAYRDQTVSFKPAPKPDSSGEVQIRSQVRSPGAQPIPIEYSLAQTPNGWKVFDVVIAGVSLVGNYRSSFAREIENGGVDGLLKALSERNRQLETAAPGAPGASLAPEKPSTH